MSAPALRVCQRAGGDEPLAVIHIGEPGLLRHATVYVYRDDLSIFTDGWDATPTDLRRLADTVEAVQSGTYQPTPTLEELAAQAQAGGRS